MKKCDKYAAYRYTWPGKDEGVCCFDHAEQLVKVADAIGMHLQIISLSKEDLSLCLKCTSNVEE